MTSETYTADVCDNNLLVEIAEEHGFHHYTIEEGEGTTKGDGYVGIIRTFKIVGTTKNNQRSILNLLVKGASKSDALRTEVPVASVFEREIYVYETVFPTFQKFETEKGLQPSFFASKLYKTRSVHKSEALVLENLRCGGYKLHEENGSLNNDHVTLVMSRYGQLHALSFALRDQYPNKFQNFVGYLDDMLCNILKEKFLKTLVHQCSKTLKTLDTNSDQLAINNFNKFIDNIVPFLDEVRDSTDKYSVFLHTDCWKNNMMFKYKDSNDTTKPIDVRFLDFQVSRIGSPVFDLAYFFYACSSKELINNLNHYMDVYYNSFSTHLRQLGSDPDKMFPYSVLKQHWKKYGKFGLLMSTLAIHAMLSEKNEITDFNDMVESGQNVADAFCNDIARVDEFNDRIRHILLNLVENNYFEDTSVNE